MPTTHYIWDPVSDNLLMEKDGNGDTIATYTHEPGLHGELISQRRNGQTYYYHYDGEGNTRAVTDQNGNIVETATYSAFGEVVEKTTSIVNPFGFKGALGYYANPETDDVYVRARDYSAAIGRWLSPDRLWFVDGLNRYLYVLNSPIGFSDPSGEFRIVAHATSCPGCGKAAIEWRFRDHNVDEWFLVQKICTTLTIQECKQGCGCEPETPKTCNKCVYERIFMEDTGGNDLWRFPSYIPDGNCGTIGFGTTISEIRTFRGSVRSDDAWKEPGEEKFCDFPRIRLGTHRDVPPSYWDKSTATYHSYMAAGWNCCNKAKTIGFMIYGTTGSNFNFLTCPTRDDPRGPITW